jgi:hypothetical protein
MAEAPVCAALEWRRVRVWGSGMFLFGRQLKAVDLEYGFGFFFLDGGKLKEGVLGGNLPVWTQQHCVGSYERCD